MSYNNRYSRKRAHGGASFAPISYLPSMQQQQPLPQQIIAAGAAIKTPPVFSKKLALPDSQVGFEITEREGKPLFMIRNWGGVQFVSLSLLELEDLFHNQDGIRHYFDECRERIRERYGKTFELNQVEETGIEPDVMKQSNYHTALKQRIARTREAEEQDQLLQAMPRGFCSRFSGNNNATRPSNFDGGLTFAGGPVFRTSTQEQQQASGVDEVDTNLAGSIASSSSVPNKTQRK